MGMSLELSRLSPSNWFRGEESLTPLAEPRGTGSPQLLPVTRLQRNIDRLFDDFFNGFGMPSGTLPGWSAPQASNELAGFIRPQLDVTETKDAYNISVEVPGVAHDDLQLSLRDNTLIISGQKKQQKREDGVQTHRMERLYGAFQRVLELPADADPDKISANHANGVLTVMVPRKPGATPTGGRRIDIKAA